MNPLTKRYSDGSPPMPNIIRLHDVTTHGGRVISVAATHFTVRGIPAACVGDQVSCPVHGPGTIIEGERSQTINELQVVYEGHKTSCGATLISTLSNFECS